MMGGEIRLEAEPGKGARFEFDLTLPDAELAVEDSVIRDVEFHRPQPQPMRILVAEDGKVNQIVIRTLLEREGHEVTIVADGRQAVEAASQDSYDAILMDVHMPEMDGLQAAQRIRSLGEVSSCNVPIFAVTASVMQEERDACLEAGMNEVIAKPIVSAELFALLARYEKTAQS